MSTDLGDAVSVTPSPVPDGSGETTGRPRERGRAAFAILAVAQGTLIFTISLITVPLPVIGREFGVGTAELVLINAAYGLPYSGLLLFGGRLADRYGGRRMLVTGLALFGAASVAAAFVPGFEALVALRSTQGVGAALTAPAAIAVLRELFPSPDAFGRVMATWGGASVIGAMLGPLASGVVTTWVSWRWMFAFPVVVAALTLAVSRALFPAGRADRGASRPGVDPVGAVLATLGISVGSFGLIFSVDLPWTSPTVLVPVVVGVVLLGAFLVVERRVRDPLLPPGFTLEPRRFVGLVAILLAAAGSGVVSFVLSVYLQQVQGWSPLATAGGYVPFTVALIASNAAAAPLVARLGAPRVTIAGLVVSAAGFALLTGIDHGSSSAAGLLPGLLLLPVGSSLVFSGSAVLSTAHVPPRQMGLAGGVMNTGMELGPTVGLAALMSVAGTRPDVVDGYVWAFGTAGTVHFVAALASAVLVRARPGAATNP
ncbi:Major Facilitator Superfamily protein [Streptoalloteichus tenebrarius]|uniref:Major Facilitator Superfamily protein n=1 Tax=Streptoalloteichus tenebrarius (strain ATCC 17920 / DSM 40477 / JCM 4838 / CBS 697.72 / NBRC 16177 / NCIMB 11028 / NRRL B-12390 / A12253. 1 / ISP 5477) TaxID=1933 RepID=A0ABT1HM84_STRSD|nr:MFS transporter [Streptoalloteichus tenebrarius]MCP2256599.1 Major Facilitator Superfamily protein [Streptoalloteichus tenebrarius]BFF04952.1 MFS transporter [Streptoalloteichus tenebrarius]